MAINEARIDRAEAEAWARMTAEFGAMLDTLGDWMNTNLSAEEWAAEERRQQGAALPGDDATLAGQESRWPPEVMEVIASLYERGFIGEDGKPRRR